MANPNTGVEKPGPSSDVARGRVAGAKAGGKAKHAVGSGRRSPSRQGFKGASGVAGQGSASTQIGVAKHAVGSGAQNLDPMTKEALRNVGC